MNHKGISHVFVLAIIAVVLGVIGSIGLLVARSQRQHQAASTSQAATAVKIDKQGQLSSNNKSPQTDTPASDKSAANTAVDNTALPGSEATFKPPQPKPCNGAATTSLGGVTYCTYTFSAEDVPARLEAYGLQTEPSRMSLYESISLKGTCTPQGACQHMSDESDVSSEEGSRLDWKIVKEAAITVSTPEQNSNYTSTGFSYEHPSEPICTSLHYYCYNLSLNFSKK